MFCIENLYYFFKGTIFSCELKNFKIEVELESGKANDSTWNWLNQTFELWSLKMGLQVTRVWFVKI